MNNFNDDLACFDDDDDDDKSFNMPESTAKVISHKSAFKSNQRRTERRRARGKSGRGVASSILIPGRYTVHVVLNISPSRLRGPQALALVAHAACHTAHLAHLAQTNLARDGKLSVQFWGGALEAPVPAEAAHDAAYVGLQLHALVD